jgi:uncharacterized membrane protein
MDPLRTALLLLHTLAGAAWFGASFYYLFVLYPRLTNHFEKVTERERLMLSLAQGARWQVVTAITLIGGSGIALALWPSGDVTANWSALVAGKGVLLVASAFLFWRVSWFWWPARLFALEPELPGIHRRFRIGAAVMLVLVGMNAVFGVVAHHLN